MNRAFLIVLLIIGILCLGIGIYLLFVSKSSPPIPQASGKHIRLPANQLWFNTGIVLSPGKNFTVHAFGKWRWDQTPSHESGPEGVGYWKGLVVKDAPLASLVGRISDSTFYVGADYSATAQQSGNLLLSLNDLPDAFYDNTGSLEVVVDVK